VIELGILGVAAAGYLGSFYWSSYLRAIGKASDDCRRGRPDLAMRRLKAAVLVPPVGKLVDHWALCLNFQAYLFTQQNQSRLAEKRLALIRKRPGVTQGVKCLCFFRTAEIKEAKGLLAEAKACRRHAQEIFESETAELERRRLWSAIALTFYGTGDYSLAVGALDQLLKHESSAPILHLKLICLEYTGADRKYKLQTCREALKRAKTPVRRASLLALASAFEVPEEPESALEAARACLEIQERLGRKADTENTVIALMSRLRAWGRLGRQDDYLVDRDRLRSMLDLDRACDVSRLGSLRYLEGRFEDWLELSTDKRFEPSVQQFRGVFLEQLGRPVEALDCLSRVRFENCVAVEMAKSHLALFQRVEADSVLSTMENRDRETYLTILSNLAYIWDGNPSLGEKLWPDDSLSGLGLRYKGRFQESTEALAREVDQACWSPVHRVALKKYDQAVNWFFLQRWAEAREQFESLLPEFDDNPVRRDYCCLYTICCQCMQGEDALPYLDAQANSMRERYSANLCIQGDVALASLQGYFGLKRYEEMLPVLSESLQGEVRAFYRGLLLDLRSRTQRALGDLAQGELDDQALLSLVPESFLSQRARVRLELP
jgi:tetratricopeptide (TPR) repeat protein